MSDVIVEIFLIFVAAKVAAEIFVRLGIPAIAAELLVGVVLGPHVLGLIHTGVAARTLAQLGIVMLLFTVGLETPLSGLVRVGRSALLTSLAGIVAAAGTGLLVTWAFGHGLAESMFAGTALAASSVGVAARVFADLGVVRERHAQIVIGAAVVDDVVALGLFPLVQGFGRHGVNVGAALIGVAGALAFLVLVTVVGTRLVRRHASLLERPRVRRSPFVLALTMCLGLAAVAERVGLSALVGAFVAGMVLADTSERYELDRRMEPLVDLLVPFFFVVTAASMDPRFVVSGSVVFALVLAVVTIVAKLVGCAVGALGLPRRGRLQVGAGMVARNEVTLVVATAGASAGILTREVFSILVAAVIVSTLVAPLLMRAAIPRRMGRGARGALDAPPETAGPAGEGDP